ncbi:hypothetical protein AA23498_3492 [Acetobacter nitrogenifigens DSM 23921 = NBRC 105050]|uniref:Antitoxin SocA-like Panacea domain-containing protein n=1 Tax=Acetobacter nitrogenifigens DSM 23921 = NBRC 105050 TaxID=1120919 RepID=A0A511XEG9_9PROT|nr:hypothetical protein [Acetobacter nitrogenifigens]GBQ99551.1 hypothetical protein AA23498_3492 [Acetobacter nitrogenifigens DSM 23921 = NBRC 105050]GEN61356.1 hypothetical protein ANI02nite_32400 [Acetobacter nitrogenifigens DSM 23921 = NBRC 105050]
MHDPNVAAAQIIGDAGGELVGRTRLQKIAYLSQLAGFGEEFEFEYRHYGPFSEGLAQGMDIAVALGYVVEEERQASWGGKYSIFKICGQDSPATTERSLFVKTAKSINAIELELAATAAFLFVAEHRSDPWAETRRRKPEKAANGRIEQAMEGYKKLRALKTVRPLPLLPDA